MVTSWSHASGADHCCLERVLVGVVDPVLSSRYYATDGRNDGGSNGPLREPIADVSDVSLGPRRHCRRWWQNGGGRDGNRSGGYGDNDGDDDGRDEDEGDHHRGDCGDEYLDNTVTSWSHAGGADRCWLEQVLVGMVDPASS